jgi:hypothetical protein
MNATQAIEILKRRNNNFARKKGITDYVRENEQIINALISVVDAYENRPFRQTKEKESFPFAAAEFSVFDAPITNIKPVINWTVREVFHYITTNELLMQWTDYLRNIDKSVKATNLPYCCFSGTFTERNVKKLQQHSNLLMIDFDHVGDVSAIQALKGRLLKDKYFDTVLMFRSPSGDGLKWLVPIDVTRHSHRQWFDGIYHYVLNTYGLAIDKSGSDIARACFLCHDRQAFINPNIYKNV